MNKHLTFNIEKVFGPTVNDVAPIRGYFVTVANKAPSADTLKDLMASMVPTEGEEYKNKIAEGERVFCLSPKEVKDCISYKLGEFIEE